MKKNATISAAEALDLLVQGNHAPIDVRSEGEFDQGHVPGFFSAPILSDAERHEVGKTYKTEGQQAAVSLGHALVAPHRAARIHRWGDFTQAANSKVALVACWRGGLRSQIACDWLQEHASVVRVEGGYKAMRAELRESLAAPPPLLVIGGFTGAGKTRLLAALPGVVRIDLEALACHRGSSFGAHHGKVQPAQATFENAIALSLRSTKDRLVLEDESASVGRLYLPGPIRLAMAAADLVYLEAKLEDRIENIFREYVADPLAAGLSATKLREVLTQGIRRLARSLGGAMTQELVEELNRAFAAPEVNGATHAKWIGRLLSDYYDKRYDHALARSKRHVAFRGNYEDCLQWILKQYA